MESAGEDNFNGKHFECFCSASSDLNLRIKFSSFVKKYFCRKIKHLLWIIWSEILMCAWNSQLLYLLVLCSSINLNYPQLLCIIFMRIENGHIRDEANEQAMFNVHCCQILKQHLSFNACEHEKCSKVYSAKFLLSPFNEKKSKGVKIGNWNSKWF